jgi:hypothetical protein
MDKMSMGLICQSRVEKRFYDPLDGLRECEAEREREKENFDEMQKPFHSKRKKEI